MIITPRPVTVADLALVPSPPRSEGVHVSTLIKALCQALEPERFSGDRDPRTYFEIGYAVEAAIEQAWASRHITVLRPGEFTLDGITGSPDGVSFEDGDMVVEEIKCTWMSSRGCPEDKKFWHWLVQMKAYGYLLGTPRARLHVLFVNGNYGDHREPQYSSWDFQFTPREIEECWTMLVNQKRALTQQGAQQP